MRLRQVAIEKPWFVSVVVIGTLCGVVLALNRLYDDQSFLCSVGSPSVSSTVDAELLEAVLHYATSPTVPQQSRGEIRQSFDVLRRRSPCNFLVFGLGHDSVMWSAFNRGGRTVFLEEDPSWIRSVLKRAPFLRAYPVRYATRMSEADALIRHYRSEPACHPRNALLKGNERCRLALSDLPDEVYEQEWDLIMVDAPRGYAANLPGRMGAIYSAAVMARSRKGRGTTHVFLHDVDRRVEAMFAREFLCDKHRVGSVGRLWHFEIPAAGNATSASPSFC